MSQPAQSLPFSDFGLQWFEDIVGRITLWFTETLIDGYESLSSGLLSTPLPHGQGTARIFSRPTYADDPWVGIYDATVGGEMMLFGLLVLFICVQGRHFIRIFDIGSAIGHRQTRRSAWTGAFLIITWYWVAVLTLYVVEGLTIGLSPNIEQIGTSLVGLLPTALSNPIISLGMAAIGALSILLLEAIFFVRELLVYVFLYVMPIGLGIAYGNVPIVSAIAQRLCTRFLALAILPIPTALLLRGYGLLFLGPTSLPVTGAFFQYLAVVSMPLLSLYVTWKTFSYAAPLASQAMSGVSRGAAKAGIIAGTAYVAGPTAATHAARWGSKGAAGAMIARRYNETQSNTETTESDDSPTERGELPEYRREENDPAYY